MKKILAYLLIFAIVLSVVPISAMAEEVCKIETAEDFVNYIAKINDGSVSSGAILENDIDLSGMDYTPPTNAYNYVFDGNNRKISGVGITDVTNASLFYSIGINGEVKNLTVDGSFSGENAASIAIENRGKLSNITNLADIIGSKYAAGITCFNYNTVSNCENMADINATNKAYGAGIIDINEKNVYNCANYGAVLGVDASLYSENVAGIAVSSTGEGIFKNNVNVGNVTGGKNVSGIVASYKSYTPMENCINFGEVSGSENVAGIASVSYAISSCANYGRVTATGEMASGVVADGYTVKNAVNYAEVSGTKKIAGIAAKFYGEIKNSFNYGDIKANERAAGIVGISYGGTISDCANYGDITVNLHKVAGIIANGENVNLERCANYGKITGSVTGDGNFIGGVASYLMGNDTNYVKDVYSIGEIDGKNTCAAVIAFVNYPVTGGFMYVSGNVAIHPSYKKYAQYLYAYKEWGYSTDYTKKFDTGEIAWMLNTYEGTQENRGVWSQGDLYPVLADENHKSTKKIICEYNGKTKTLFTDKDGFARFDSDIPESAKFTAEDGDELTYDEVFGAKGESETAYVYTADEFIDASSNANVNEIVLMRGIILEDGVYFNGAKKIEGNNNAIVISAGGCETESDLTLENVSVLAHNGIKANGGKVKIVGNVGIDKAMEILAGEICVTDGRILNPNAKNGEADFTAEENVWVNAPKYVLSENGYMYLGKVKNGVAWDIVAKAEDNPTLNYDVYATIKDGKAYMFMPCVADITNVVLTILDKEGNESEKMEKIDLSNEKTITVVVKGREHVVSAMQSTLPTLAFTINEEWGTIEAMNTDPEHDTKCYGDVRLDVTEDSGFEGFVSKENDKKKNGTMELKGRGNSTWSVEPGVKKPYQFKLEKKTDILGMGKHKTWIILKNDEQLIRNKLGLDLADMLGLEYSSKSEFVDVFMNGEYLGVYLLCEKVQIGENRVGISDLDDEFEENGDSVEGLDLTGGYLLEIDNWGGDALQIYHEMSNMTLSVKSPENLAKSVSDDNAYAYIKDYMTKWLDSVHTDGLTDDGYSYLDMMDVESFVRYFFHQEFLRNGDCGRGSTYMYKDKDSVDPYLHAGPVWDSDRIYEGVQNTEGWFLQTINYAEKDMPTFYNVLNRREDFAKLLVYYYEKSDIAAVLEKSPELIDEYVKTLGIAPEMNRIRWGYENKFDVSWIKTTMQKRFKWIDENYKTLLDVAVPELVNIDRTAEDGKLVFDVYNNTGEKKVFKIYAAEYTRDGEFVKAQTWDEVMLNSKDRTQTFALEKENAENVTAVFVWDENMNPVAKKIKY